MKALTLQTDKQRRIDTLLYLYSGSRVSRFGTLAFEKSFRLLLRNKSESVEFSRAICYCHPYCHPVHMSYNFNIFRYFA